MALLLAAITDYCMSQRDEYSLQSVTKILDSPAAFVADFNGASAAVAEFPVEFQQPSALDINGIETKGTFTARSSGSYGVKYVAIHGVLNHPINCELKGYRILTGAFAGILKMQRHFMCLKSNTICAGEVAETGYKHIFGGISSVRSGPIPPGTPGEVDIITCTDIASGENQRFRSDPVPWDGEAFGITPDEDYYIYY